MRGTPSSHPCRAYFWGFHVGVHIPALWVASGHL